MSVHVRFGSLADKPSAGYLAAIGKAVGQAIGVRVDDLPLRLENIGRALWARPDVTA